jgi:hypothetical protein
MEILSWAPGELNKWQESMDALLPGELKELKKWAVYQA